MLPEVFDKMEEQTMVRLHMGLGGRTTTTSRDLYKCHACQCQVFQSQGELMQMKHGALERLSKKGQD